MASDLIRGAMSRDLFAQAPAIIRRVKRTPCAWAAVGLAVLSSNTSCKRRAVESDTPAGESDANPALPTTMASTLPSGGGADPAIPGRSRVGPASGEAERRLVKKAADDPFLRPYSARIDQRFKTDRAPLNLQRATLFGGGTALLVKQDSEPFPLLLVEDRDRTALWDRDKPTAAMIPPVRDPVIVGRSKGGVALFAYDVPAKVLAGRLLDPDGTPFADLTVIHTDDCQWLSAAHWPKRGMVVTCARLGGSRLQIVRDDNTIALAPEGVAVGGAFRSAAPMSIAFDSDSTMMLTQYATKDGKDHAMVFRYDAEGAPAWTEPRDLGEVPKLDPPWERIATSSGGEGAVRITLPKGVVGNEATHEITVDSAGAVHF